MGDGMSSGFFKEETAEFKMQNSNSYRCLRSSYHIVSSLKENTPSASASGIPLGLRAPIIGSEHFRRNGSNGEELSRSRK